MVMMRKNNERNIEEEGKWEKKEPMKEKAK